MKIVDLPPQYFSELRRNIASFYRKDEALCLDELLPQAEFTPTEKEKIAGYAIQLVNQVRQKRLGSTGLDAFLAQYQLSTQEGIALMCMAEALLRIPDKATADRLIHDKILSCQWQDNLGHSHSLFVNAATWGLILTGKLINVDAHKEQHLKHAFQQLIAKTSKPVIRTAIYQAMKILGQQFVMGRTIEEALNRARDAESSGYRHSYDMLGEAAKTAEDAERYFVAYCMAIHAIGQSHQAPTVFQAPGISVKLSALYPRYEFSKQQKALSAVVPKLLELTVLAKQYGIGLTVDAEEANRLDLSLDIIEAVYSNEQLSGYEGFGLAVQSYQKRAPHVIEWLAFLAKKYQRRWMIRLIKGAYWDSEIKVSQENGFEDYPVYTRKYNTDVSFLACAKKILQYPEAFYPQFATHNAHSVSAILALTENIKDMEFQCLHGMGRPLYDEIVPKDKFNRPCRVYAPVGSHEDLLAYLVRRLLENGANSSFVNRIIDEKMSIDNIIADPIEKAKAFRNKRHPQIPKPVHLYGATRMNSKGLDLSNPIELEALNQRMDAEDKKMPWHAEPLLASGAISAETIPVFSPVNHTLQIGSVKKASKEHVAEVLVQAQQGFEQWHLTKAEYRADLLDKVADLFEAEHARLMTIISREGGKTLSDAVSEVREAVDFCRYYAEQARLVLKPQVLPGPTGEHNQLALHGRGIAVCISPWNFPLAIFVGQLSAALAAGNAVIAKPADQTPLIAYAAVELFYQAGFPRNVLQLLIGKGSQIGNPLLADNRVKAVLFTGSTETAQMINQLLASRSGAIVPFIAETGGQNAMIVDSSALPEQVVSDVITSAFGSAGQRCSALRVLFLQEDIADKVLKMLAGAMAELVIGEPHVVTTDIGPVIDEAAKQTLDAHLAKLNQCGQKIYQMSVPAEIAAQGSYFGPAAYEILRLDLLEREVFGPILHVIRFKQDELVEVVNQINATGYGLTLGIHSRIQETIEFIQKRVKVGNCYVNRSMIGAVVGVQPFGGENLSGTGPKAGGPHYLPRLCVERTLTINLAATGGNAKLVSLDQEVD